MSAAHDELMDPERVVDIMGEQANDVERRLHGFIDGVDRRLKATGIPKQFLSDTMASLLWLVAIDALAISLQHSGSLPGLLQRIPKALKDRLVYYEEPPETEG